MAGVFSFSFRPPSVTTGLLIFCVGAGAWVVEPLLFVEPVVGTSLVGVSGLPGTKVPSSVLEASAVFP